MNRGEIVEEIRNKLGYNTGLSSTLINNAIMNAQTLLEQEAELPWFLETPDYVDHATTAGVEYVDLASDFIMFIVDSPVWVYDVSATNEIYWTEVKAKSRRDLRNVWNDQLLSSTTGKPTHYYLQGNRLRLFPTPDAAYTLKFLYYQKQAELDAASSTNGWSINAPFLLVGKAGMLLTENNRSKTGLEIFTAIYRDAAFRLGVTSEQREAAGDEHVRGGED